jgi:hypothetical protein
LRHLADRDDDRTSRTDPHVESPEYDDLFLRSYSPTLDGLFALQGDQHLAARATETALRQVGTCWSYVEHSPDFVRALATVFYLRTQFRREEDTQFAALARERRQGRSLSSAHDVVLDAGQWLDDFLDRLGDRQRIVDLSVLPLSRLDLAELLVEGAASSLTTTAAALWQPAANSPLRSQDLRREKQ